MRVAKGMCLLLLAMLVCKYTEGGGAALLAVVAFACALTGRTGWALMGYMLFPFMVIMNPVVLPKAGATGAILRVSTLALSLALLVTAASRRGNNQIPIGLLWLYLGAATISSMSGYYPMISYLKIVNFAIILIGIQLGFRNIDKRPRDAMLVRNFLLVLTAFLIWGSLALRIVMPGAAYMTSVSRVLAEEGVQAANAAISALQSSQGTTLFAGITNQSQCLATILPCAMAWLACDMFFVEKRISSFHLLTLTLGLPMLYMTRSRSAFLTAFVGSMVIYFYCLKKINISARAKSKLRTVATLAGLGVILLCVGIEVKDHSISKWLRKTNDVELDERGFAEAFTASRQGKADANLADFKTNPMFGTGFQVTYDMQYLYRGSSGLVLSAPLEKSILPLMVLGETGLLGFAVFLLFLGVFYGTCMKKRYFCTMTLMTVFLTTNLAEATFFSPGGVGGTMWVMCVGGGFVVDMIVLHHRKMEAALLAQRQMMMPNMRR